ncbi:MAG: nucleotidyltransferase family protein [Xanthobacteraceae bacterium]
MLSHPITITPDQQLLLRAALDKPEHALRCFAEWWSRVDIEHTGTTEYRLLPLVYNNIGRLIADKAAAARVRGVAKHVWLSNSKNVALGTYALDRLTAAKVPTAIIKGSALLVAVASETMRSMGDCDILVPVERAAQALAVLDKVGFHGTHDGLRFTAYDFKLFHGLSVRRLGEQTYHLDIHWRPLRDVGADGLTREFFDRSVPCQFSGRDTRRPCFEHMLLHAAVHGTAWAEVPRYDWLADATLILRAAGPAFDWGLFADTADRYLLGSIASAALNELARILDVPIEARALRRPSRRSTIDRAEARWRCMDPAKSRWGRRLVALQAFRRGEDWLVGRSVWAVVPAIWRRIFGPVLSAQTRADVEARGEDHAVYLAGWSFAESAGRWTDGPFAALAIERAHGRKSGPLRIAGSVFQAGPDGPQTVDIYSGWRHLARLARQTVPRVSNFVEFIPLPSALQTRDVLYLQFLVRGPVAPCDIGLSADPRRLGLFLQDIRCSPCERDAAASPLNLNSGSHDLAVLWSGWSVPESDGCWSDGVDARLQWTSPRDLPADARLVIRGFGFVPGTEPLRGSISINGRPAGDLSRFAPGTGLIDLSIPIRADLGERIIEVHFHFEDPRSPRELGLSSDDRKLGLFLKSIWIEPDAPD